MQIMGAVPRRVPVPQIQKQIVDQAAPMADVPVIMQLEFPQSMSYVNQEAPQIQSIVGVPDIPVATRRWVLTVQTVRQNVEIPQVPFWAGC